MAVERILRPDAGAKSIATVGKSFRYCYTYKNSKKYKFHVPGLNT